MKKATSEVKFLQLWRFPKFPAESISILTYDHGFNVVAEVTEAKEN